MINKKWKFSASMSLILTGLLLTIALNNKGNFVILVPQLLMVAGIVLYIKIARQNFEIALKEICSFLMRSLEFFLALSFLIIIYHEKDLSAVSVLAVITGILFLDSFRYFFNFGYNIVRYVERITQIQKQKADIAMWIITFLSESTAVILILKAIVNFFITR